MFPVDFTRGLRNQHSSSSSLSTGHPRLGTGPGGVALMPAKRRTPSSQVFNAAGFAAGLAKNKVATSSFSSSSASRFPSSASFTSPYDSKNNGSSLRTQHHHHGQQQQRQQPLSSPDTSSAPWKSAPPRLSSANRNFETHSSPGYSSSPLARRYAGDSPSDLTDAIPGSQERDVMSQQMRSARGLFRDSAPASSKSTSDMQRRETSNRWSQEELSDMLVPERDSQRENVLKKEYISEDEDTNNAKSAVSSSRRPRVNMSPMSSPISSQHSSPQLSSAPDYNLTSPERKRPRWQEQSSSSSSNSTSHSNPHSSKLSTWHDNPFMSSSSYRPSHQGSIQPVRTYGRLSSDRRVLPPSLASVSKRFRFEGSSDDTDRSQGRDVMVLTDEKENLPPDYKMNGFRNLGNTCYMNSVLQALLHLTSFKAALLKAANSGSFQEDGVSRALIQIFREKSDDQVMVPSQLRECIRRDMSKFDSSQQEDAHEFLSDLIDHLACKLAAEQQPFSEASDGNETNPDGKLKGSNLLDDFFRIDLEQVLRCNGCKASSEKIEWHRVLSLDLPTNRSGNSEHVTRLSVLLDTFFESESVEYSCSKCQHPNATISLRFRELGQVLVLHLKRFAMNMDVMDYVKKSDKVNFDPEIDLARWSSLSMNSSNNLKYKLTAVVSHLGKSAKRGHFVCDTYNESKKLWFTHDDSVCRRLGSTEDLQNERSQSGYMLVYERMV